MICHFLPRSTRARFDARCGTLLMLLSCALVSCQSGIVSDYAAVIDGPPSAGDTGATGPGGSSDSGDNDNDLPNAGGNTVGDQPFYPLSAASYAQKVKSLITGEVASAKEVSQAQDDQGLAALIDTWMASPNYDEALLTFFGLAFQQSQFKRGSVSAIDNEQYAQDLREMFPRTMLYYVKNNMPFTKVATTQTFMMTPRLLMYYALADAMNPPGGGTGVDWPLYNDPNFTYIVRQGGGATTIEDFTDPQSPNYFVFANNNNGSNLKSDICGCVVKGCPGSGNDIIFNGDLFTYGRANDIYNHLLGYGFVYYTHAKGGNNYCYLQASQKSFMQPADATWRLVTLLEAESPAQVAQIWDLKKFRTADTIYFRVPRVGFFTTLSFLRQWPTNDNNQFRVTINQTLIAGLNKTFDGSDRTMPLSLAGLTEEHAEPNTPCYSCHLTMDPMRQYFRSQYTNNYAKQSDASMTGTKGYFAQDGVSVGGGNILQLGQQIATSPLFGLGWTVKLCNWLNDGACDARDPEVLRLAKAFEADNFNFNHLVKAVLLSPLTTRKSKTLSAANRGARPTMARKDQFCRMMSARLNVKDVCDLLPRTDPTAPVNLKNVRKLMVGYPTDAYSRGTEALAQPTEPSAPSRIGLETVCGYLSMQFVDNGGASPFLSSDANRSLDAMTTQVMGLSLDANAQVRGVLGKHYQDAIAAQMSKTDALRSAFMVSCMSPHVVLLGL